MVNRDSTLLKLEHAIEVLEEKYQKIEEGSNPRRLKWDCAISEYRLSFQEYSQEVGTDNWHKLARFSARAEPIIGYVREALKY